MSAARSGHANSLAKFSDSLQLADHVLMTRGGEFEKLFGHLPDTREQAAATYAETLASLDIEGGDVLAEACASELNMMRKLASIRRKLQRPGYREFFTQEKIVAFILDDDFLHSSLTDIDYEANSKSEM